MDLFRTVGVLGLGSRLKRLSDIIMTQGKDIYLQSGIEFEPKWFPIMFLLKENKSITITDAAASLQTTHPHVSLLVKEMNKAKLINFAKNKGDARSRHIVLSSTGEKVLCELQPLWKKIQQAVQEVVNETQPEFLELINKMEISLQKRPLSERMTLGRSQVKILDYQSKYKKYFEGLNREWLEKHFSVEPIDEKYFRDPEKEIIKKGGQILFAEYEGKIVGTVSLLKEGAKWELAKMAVTESVQGKGIGELLVQEVLRRSRKLKLKKVILVTNSQLRPAIGLYKKLGFIETFRGPDPKYSRGDVVMEILL